MSYSCNDQSERLQALLMRVGYTVHEGETNDRPDLGMNAHWFCWGVDGTDIEVGDAQDSELAAWSSAMEHWFDNAKIETYTS